MKIINVSLPPKIYRYASRVHLDQSLHQGAFRLRPASEYGEQHNGLSASTAAPRNYLVICFSDYHSDTQFDTYPESDACLVINDVLAFSERLHLAVESALPGWHGIEARVSYGKPNQLGPVFSRPLALAHQREFRFVWQPEKRLAAIESVEVKMGSIADIADIIERPKAN